MAVHDNTAEHPDEGTGAVRNEMAATSIHTVVQAGVVHGGVHVHARPDRVPPHQLPLAPAGFVGRVDQLAQLDKTLVSPTPLTDDDTSTAVTDPSGGGSATAVISALGGAGGIGKTWLALTWAHRHLDQFPDGQLFTDLRGFDPTGPPKHSEDALRGFLEALGVDRDRQPSDLDAQAALYRSLVADKRMLIVLDNAATTDQVAPLLPGTGRCAVLVTSRHRLPALLTRHGARSLYLDVLTAEESRALLTAAVGPARIAAANDATTELIGLCGGLPLALGLVASRVVVENHPSLLEVVAELRDLGLDALHSADPMASVPAVLSWSLHQLTDQQRAVFGLLGIAPGPDISLPAAASLLGLSAQDARAVLRELGDASLITRTRGPRYVIRSFQKGKPTIHAPRYAMHDLVRAYATTHAHTTLPEPELRAALERIVDFYLENAQIGDQCLDSHHEYIQLSPLSPFTSDVVLGPPGWITSDTDSGTEALVWFDAEHACLLAAQQTAITHRWYPAVWNLAWTLYTFHCWRGHLHEQLAAWQAALDAAHWLPNINAKAIAHRSVGYAYARLGRYDEAVSHLDQALALAQEDLVEQAHVHRTFAWALGRQRQYRRALKHASMARGIYRAGNHRVWESLALNDMGWLSARLGHRAQAQGHFQAAVTLCYKETEIVGGGAYGETVMHVSLGYLHLVEGAAYRARDHYEEAVTMLRQLGDTYDAADALDGMSHAYVALGQFDQARTVWHEAMALYGQQRRDDDTARVQQQLNDLNNTTTGGTPPDSVRHP